MLSDNRARVIRHSFFVLLAAVATQCVLFTACGPTPTAPGQFAPYSQTDLRAGSGTEASTGDTVGVLYTLWLYDSSKPDGKGLQLETSGTSPFSFQLGAHAVIAGWERGVPGMRVGGLRRLVVPPDLAYGDTRSGIVPANATLVFDIELVSVQ